MVSFFIKPNRDSLPIVSSDQFPVPQVERILHLINLSFLSKKLNANRPCWTKRGISVLSINPLPISSAKRLDNAKKGPFQSFTVGFHPMLYPSKFRNSSPSGASRISSETIRATSASCVGARLSRGEALLSAALALTFFSVDPFWNLGQHDSK